MTIPQLLAELSSGAFDPKAVQAKGEPGRRAFFDKVCEKFCLTPIRLSACSADQIAGMIRGMGITGALDLEKLVPWAREYAGID